MEISERPNNVSNSLTTWNGFGMNPKMMKTTFPLSGVFPQPVVAWFDDPSVDKDEQMRIEYCPT